MFITTSKILFITYDYKQLYVDIKNLIINRLNNLSTKL